MLKPDLDSRAITEIAKAGGKIAEAVGKGIDASKELGHFLAGSSLKEIPRSVVGLLGGDWLIGKQIENIIRVQKRIHDVAAAHGLHLDPSTLPWRTKVEFIRGMADEDDEDMQAVWARLVVNASRDDGAKQDIDRIILDVVHRLSSQSVKLFLAIQVMAMERGETLMRGTLVQEYAATSALPVERVAMLVDHLTQLRCVQHRPVGAGGHVTTITALGRTILAATTGLT